MADDHDDTENTNVEDLEREPDVYYKPVVELKPVKIVTHEEDEEELVRLRCKLYRYAYDADDIEWKERGIGDIKLLKHPETDRIRVVMRREKVFTVCCNHYLKPGMQLSRAAGTTSDRAVVWSTLSDFADGDAKRETFAARFQSPEIADQFRDKWNEITDLLAKADEKDAKKADAESSQITEALDKMKIKNKDNKEENVKGVQKEGADSKEKEEATK